jgi:hypothetical protein
MNQTTTQVPFNLPPGYTSLSSVDRMRHAGLAVPPNLSRAWCGKLNGLFINAGEMGKACIDYPIAFVRDTSNGEFLPLAVLGLRSGENLFVDAEGQWQTHTYVPAYVRRYPFCIVELPPQPGSSEHQRLIAVQEDQLKPSDKPYFSAAGEPTPEWQPVQELVEAMEGARQQTRSFTRRLEAFGLFTSFDALALPRGGGNMRLQGLYRVDEEKLNNLGNREQKLLMRKGELRAVYAHLLSLENFGKLLDLTQMRATAAA